MDYTEYTAAKNRLSSSPNLCDLFKLLSIETWKRIEYAYLRKGIKVFETTITQNLIFSINAYNDQYGLGIEIFEAADEKTNGNDFELIIKFPAEGLEFYSPVQAKKTYRDGKYLSMDHGDQIDSLINYALKTKSTPLYLLYNFTSAPTGTLTSIKNPIDLFGCTLIPASYLHSNYYKKRSRVKADGTTELTWKIPNFNDLNPSPAFPWHKIVCPDSSTKLRKVLEDAGIIKPIDSKGSVGLVKLDDVQGFYPIGTFIKDANWKNITDVSFPKYDDGAQFVGRKLDDDNFSVQSDSIDSAPKRLHKSFAPRSRIILSQ